jgi:cobalt-zinc-cadmium efflux system outer membrane protein
MRLRHRPIWLAALALAAGGCASYHPAPLQPQVTAQRLARRSLSAPGLCDYLRVNLGASFTSCPPPQWDLGALTLVGFYYHPDIDVAEARVEQADAAIITAGARPNPVAGLGPEFSTRSPGVVPWGLGAFNVSLRIETAGKRGYRIAEAQQLANAAKLELSQTAWTVRSRIRAAMLAYLLDVRERDLWEENLQALGQMAELVKARMRAGAASAPELAFAQSVLDNARVKAAEAAARVPQDRNQLAAAMGVPVSALAGAHLSLSGLERPPRSNSLSPAEVQRTALLNRVDLRVALARYAAADEALKLELAKQYPDINLLGGYGWDAGDNIFDIGPSIVLPIFNQNQGPIAEAEARRKELGAEFLAMQAGVIAQARGALENYRGALAAMSAAQRAARLQEQRVRQAARAFAAGETGALTLSQTQLQYLAARQTRLATLRNAQTSLGALEDVVQRPLETGDIGSFVFPARQVPGAAQQS